VDCSTGFFYYFVKGCYDRAIIVIYAIKGVCKSITSGS